MEKQKLVYILNRDIAARLTIGSPLEAHKSHTIVQYCTGVDVGFENPIFACLEVDYTEADQDPTGEAYRETEKVTKTFFQRFRLVDQRVPRTKRGTALTQEKP
jgi:splicing factor 3B subunit 3